MYLTGFVLAARSLYSASVFLSQYVPKFLFLFTLPSGACGHFFALPYLQVLLIR